MAMLAVVMSVLVVVSLSAVAVQQTVGSLSQTVDGRNILQTTDAASAGIQAELAALKGVETAFPGTTIPCSNGTVTVATAGDPAGRQAYTLSMTQPVSTEGGALYSPLVACSSGTFTVPTGMDPWYVAVRSAGSDASTSRTGQAGRTVEAVIRVSDTNSAPVVTTTTTTTVPTGSTSTTAPTTTTTVAPSGFYNSAASAQIINLNMLNNWTAYQYTNPAESVTNNGFASSAPVSVQQTVSVPAADVAVGATLGAEVVQADQSGSSYSCAAVLSSGGSLSGGSSTTACSTSGNSSGGVTINLLGLPTVSAALSSIVGGLTLNIDAATCWATDNAGGSSTSGSSSLLNASVTVKTLGLLPVTKTVSLNLSSSIAAQTNLLPAINLAISSTPGLGSVLATSIATALSPVLSMTANYQTLSGGVFTVRALHLALLNSAATADLAICGVGPNSSYTPSTTTTTTSTTVPVTTTTTTPTTTVALPPSSVTLVLVEQVA